MTVKNYETFLSSTWSKPRAIDAILDDFANPSGTDMEHRVAEIELHIAEGDNLARGRKYEGALSKYKEARGLIYKILYPGFNVSAYANQRLDLPLPLNPQIEASLLQATVSIADINRPKTVPTAPVVEVNPPQIAKEVALYTQDGYRELISGEAAIQQASEEAVTLLGEGKASAAARLLESTLARTKGQRIEPAMLGALTLNLAAAQISAGQGEIAVRNATLAQRQFQSAKDGVGVAQALHMGAIGMLALGNRDRASEMFKAAADRLAKESTTPTSLPTPPPIPRRLLASTISIVATRPDLTARVRGAIIRPNPDLVVNRDVKSLEPIAKMDSQTLTYRLPGRDEVWGALPVINEQDRKRANKIWQVSVPVGQTMASFKVGEQTAIKVDDVVAQVYAPRKTAQSFADLELTWVGLPSTTFYLTYLYAYGLLVKIGDMYFALGQFKQAEANYQLAAQYTHLNLQLEASTLWTRLARNALMWGHSLYKEEDLPAAKAQYEKLITTDAKVPGGFLYQTAALKVPADDARNLIQNLQVRPLPAVNWEIAIFVLTAFQYLQQILDGLDFYGLALSPIHTFEYLQSVARGFAEEAIQAEREFVTFKMREETEAATRRDLETTKAMAEAEADARLQQYLAAQEDENAAQDALNLSIQRRDNAVDQRNQYAASSAAQIWGQAAATALGAGEDAYYSEISELADKLARGETIHGAAGKLAAAQVLYGGRKTREYELAKMNDNINELNQAINMAQDQLDAAKRRTAAAEIGWQAALQRAQMADEALKAFDDEFFTPETWSKMADVMRDISRAYLFNAIRIAKLMERAYNFENDTALKIIKNDYGHGLANTDPGQDNRLLGGDSLLKDIESFTYYAITTKTRKSSRIKDVISVSADFPAQFQQFLENGLLSLETDLYEFDRRHPGYYTQRMEAVEVQFIGALPEGGVNGTLTIGGVTRYRRKDGTAAERVHQVDTMALSEFVLRNDAFLYQAETGVRGLFQGFGLGATWQLHLPRRGNSFDFHRIFDVQLIIYYTALYDPALRTQVLNKPLRADELATLTTYSLRHVFPDAWYSFYQDATSTLSLTRFQMPANQHNFVIQGVHFRVDPESGVDPSGIDLRIVGPNGVDAQVTTNADGIVSTEDAALAGLVGADPLADWQVSVVGGASVVENGEVQPGRIYNIQMGLEYRFEYLPEAI